MKSSVRTIRVRLFGGEANELITHYLAAWLAPLAPNAWQPAINAFSCSRCIRVCVDLAGVEKSQIEVKAEPLRLVVRGTREAPEPLAGEDRAERVLALEIDYGPFQREILLPQPVDVDGIIAEQRNGLLWIEMPLDREEAR